VAYFAPTVPSSSVNEGGPLLLLWARRAMEGSLHLWFRRWQQNEVSFRLRLFGGGGAATME